MKSEKYHKVLEKSVSQLVKEKMAKGYGGTDLFNSESQKRAIIDRRIEESLNDIDSLNSESLAEGNSNLSSHLLEDNDDNKIKANTCCPFM